MPDGSADSFLATHATVQAARMAGAQILNYHEVVDLLVSETDGHKRVSGAKVRDVARGEDVEIHAQMTISATGAWANRLAHMAGISISVIPGKGTMVAMNHRMLNTVVNRCKMPADGDIIVPVHTVAVIGTTDERVADPENLRIEPWEVQLMLDEGDKLIPGISRARWCGPGRAYVLSTRRTTPGPAATQRASLPCWTTRSATTLTASSPLPAASGPPSG